MEKTLKSFSILCLILGMVFSPAPARAGLKGKLGTSNPLGIKDVQFFDAQNGFAAFGEGSGAFGKTTDGGKTWEFSLATSMGAAVNSAVYFLNTNTGWLVGTLGKIVKTTDGGVTWTLQNSGTNQSLWDVHFTDANTGWVVGDGGLILKTTDGGSTWTGQTSGTGAALNSLQFIDANTGWVVGANGAILKTIDGGSNWTLQTSNPVVTLNGLKFVDANTGWVVGNGGAIFKTIDGGSNWTVQTSGTASNLYRVDFVNSTQGVVSSNSLVARTSDGGSNWATTTITDCTSAKAIWMFDNNNVFLGESSTAEQTFSSTDGGATWTKNSENHSIFLNKWAYHVMFFTSDIGVAMGDSGTIARTTDGGETWTEISSGTTNGLNRGFVLNATTGWIGGYGGTVLKTTDAGATWTIQPTDTNQVLNKPQFLDENNGWISAGSGGRVLKTTNGGATWTSQLTGFMPGYFAIHFTDLNTGWAVGSSGTILKTVDGGSTWTAQTSGTTNTLYDVAFLNANTGWVVGASGTLLKTTNGGSTWTAQTTGIPDAISKLIIVNSKIILASGTTYLLSTRDSVDTWTSVKVLTGFLSGGFTQNGEDLWAGARQFLFKGRASSFFSGLELVDTNPPTPGTVTDEGAYSGSTTTLSASWTGFTDSMGITQYSYSIGTSAGDTSVLNWTNGNLETSFLATGLSLSSGTQYFVNVRAKDEAGNLSNVASSNGLTVDTAAPTGGVVTDEGVYSGSASTLSASWSGFSDPLSGIGEYRYSIGTSAGDSSIKDWTSAGTSTQVLVTGLNLSSGTQYFVNVQALDALSHSATALSSDGITVDTVVPTSGTVIDDGTSTDRGNQLSASWSGFSDQLSGVAQYSYSIGTSAGDTSVKDWTSVGLDTSVTATGLNLTDMGNFFINVRARDAAGNLSAVASSNGIQYIADQEAPSAGAVSDTGAYTSSTITLAATVSGFSDNASVTAYEYSIGTAAGGTTVRDWTNGGAGTTITATGLTLSNGTQYFINVRAKDAVGNTSAVVSTDGITVDTEGPVGGTVSDQGATTGSNTQLSATWTGFSDGLSGLGAYSISIGTSAGDSSVKAWTNVGNVTSTTLTGLNLAENVTYFINVRAEDVLSNSGVVVSSDGIEYIADQEVPTAGTVSDSGAYTSSTATLTVTVSGFSDNAGIASYEYSIGTAAGGTTVRDWTNNGAGTTITATGLTLTSGTQYFINVRARDARNNVSSIVSTDGITVDTAAPDGGTVMDEGTTTGNGTQLVGNWSGFTDALSGVAEYSYSIGTSAGDSSIKAWTNAGTSTSVTVTGLQLVDQQTYFINVRAKDAMDNLGEIKSSDGIRYIADQSGPSAGTVTDEGILTLNKTRLIASWSGFSDASGIAEYSVSVGTAAGDISTVAWTSRGTQTTIELTGLNLTIGSTYFVNVRAKDVFGNLSQVVSSDGILMATVDGDLDGNGKIDLADAVLANYFATGKATPTAAQILFADVAEPKDGKITTEDANLILRCAKGTIRGNPAYPWCPVLAREANN